MKGLTVAAVVVAVACQFLLVAGQLLLKHAMTAFERGGDGSPRPWRRVAPRFAAGVGLLSAWFFLWLGLLAKWDLSHLFPFEGLNPALLVVGAWAFLKERVPLYAWAGIGLISLGVALVSGS